MRASPLHLHRLGLLGLGLLAAPLGAAAQVLYNNGGTVFVNTGGTLQVNGDLRQTGTATLRTAGTATVTGTVNNNATLNLAAGQLNVAGDMFNGLFATTTGTTGTLRLYGPANQRLSAFGAQVPNLTVDKSAGTATMLSTVQVRRVLTIADAGNLDTGGQLLQLLSDATGTALVVNSGTGVVTGSTATVQRYIDGSLNPGAGYRHFSAPVSGSTVADLATARFAPVVNTSYNTSATPGTVTPFPTVFGYDQSRVGTVASNYTPFDQGWVSPAALTSALVPGQGYAVQLAASQVVDFNGLLGTGDLTLPLSRGSSTAAGWALVGNPYPAPLDWSQVAAADRPGLDAAVYVVQSTGPYAGGYRAYVNGQSTTGANNPLIATAQGFFVRVSQGNASGSLTFRNGQRVADYATAQGTSFQRTLADSRPGLRLTLAGAGLADGWAAYAEAGATPALDAAYDAAKLPNGHGLNLSSAAGPDQLAIDGRPAFTAATVLPLAVGVPAAGTYTLSVAALANLPAGLAATLHDAQAGTRTPLASGTSYAFSVTATEAAALLTGRFSVSFGTATPLAATPATVAAQVLLYPNPAREQALLSVPGVAGASSVQAELLNALGQVVGRQQAALPASGARLVLPTAGLASGVYVVRLTAGAVVLTKRLTVQ